MADIVPLRRKQPSPLDRAASAMAATPSVDKAEARALARICLIAAAPGGDDYDEAIFTAMGADPASARAVVEDWIKAVLS